MSDLEMAEAIDAMEAEVTDWEASFLENVLPKLRKGLGLTEPQRKALRRMANKYRERGDLSA